MEEVPITEQPGASQQQFGFLAPGPKPGLESLQPLAALTKVGVHQRWPECLELFGFWEYKNEYRIKNLESEQVALTAKEQSTIACRAFCANAREFKMPIVDNDGREVLRLERPFRWCMYGCCDFTYPNHTSVIEVYTGDHYLGKILEVPSFCHIHPSMEVIDAEGKKLFRVTGPTCSCICCSNVDFPITDYNDGSDVGNVEWIWRGFKSVFTDSDVFTLEMPRNLELDKKALLIGAAMHVDFYYFEKKNDN